MINLTDIIKQAAAKGRKLNYLPQDSEDLSFFQALADAVNAEIGSGLPTVVATVSLDLSVTADATVTNIAILTGLDAGVYVFYGSHFVTTTTAASGQHSFTVNIDPTGGGSGSYPVASNPLSLTSVNNLTGQITSYVAQGTDLTWNYVISGFTTGSADVSVRLTIVKLP